MRRLLIVCSCSLLGFAGNAQAARVEVEYEALPTFARTVVADAVDAGVNLLPSIRAEADLVGSASGARLQAVSSAEGNLMLAPSVSARIVDLTLTNLGAAPVSIGGPDFPLVGTVTTRPQQFGQSIDGATQNRLTASLQVNDPGCSCIRTSGITFQVDQGFSGGILRGPFVTLTPTRINGGSVSVAVADESWFAATLWMPAIQLPPGGSVVVQFSFSTFAATNSPVMDAVTDGFSQGARLRLFVPPGSNVATDVGSPVPWITVPEPSTASMGTAGFVSLAALGWRRGRRRA